MEEKNRLKANRDFQSVYRQGSSYWNQTFTLIKKRGGGENPRIGFSISKKLGNAVTRNRLKRRLREISRLNISWFQGNCDYVVIPKKRAVDLSYEELEREMYFVTKRARNTRGKRN